MKKYLGVTFALLMVLTMGSASAVVFQTSSFNTDKYQLVIGTLGGGCGGHGGCHNNTNMTELTGLLTYDGSRFKINDTILNFGCYNYLNTTISPYDFDGDGALETILNELFGMVGTTITVDGFLNCMGSRLVVYLINGIEYREWCCFSCSRI